MIRAGLSEEVTFDYSSDRDQELQGSESQFKQREPQVGSPRDGSQQGLFQSTRETTGQGAVIKER